MRIKENLKTNKFLNIISVAKASALFWIFSFTILTAVAAQVTIPFKPVPFTLQTMMVLLAGAFLGAKNGAYSQVLYLALGAAGLPVFAYTPEAGIGLARLIGPTGGYLLAFPLAAFLVGYIIEKNQKYITVVISMFLGSIVIILSGTLFLSFTYLHNFSEAVKAGAAIFSVWMVVKVFAAASVYFAVSKKQKRLP
ncbi:MAG: biotin transporter BioY [Ignavibacteriaceae bacterium]|nr:biotin transporter BioY [Ignavibacteriaceae bacterium]